MEKNNYIGFCCCLIEMNYTNNVVGLHILMKDIDTFSRNDNHLNDFETLKMPL